jgi:hypothetical protein
MPEAPVRARQMVLDMGRPEYREPRRFVAEWLYPDELLFANEK